MTGKQFESKVRNWIKDYIKRLNGRANVFSFWSCVVASEETSKWSALLDAFDLLLQGRKVSPALVHDLITFVDMRDGWHEEQAMMRDLVAMGPMGLIRTRMSQA